MPRDDRTRERLYSNAVLRRLRWPVARRLGVHAWGDERSRLTGPGVEYADVREYQWGEDARLIDWNLTALSDRPFVRESHPDRGLDVWLIVDTSRSLDWGTTYSLKRDVAGELLAAATLLLSRHGNRVGAILFDSELRRVFAPRAGRTGRLGLLASMESESARTYGDGKRTDLARTLARAATKMPRQLRRCSRPADLAWRSSPSSMCPTIRSPASPPQVWQQAPAVPASTGAPRRRLRARWPRPDRGLTSSL